MRNAFFAQAARQVSSERLFSCAALLHAHLFHHAVRRLPLRVAPAALHSPTLASRVQDAAEGRASASNRRLSLIEFEKIESNPLPRTSSPAWPAAAAPQ